MFLKIIITTFSFFSYMISLDKCKIIIFSRSKFSGDRNLGVWVNAVTLLICYFFQLSIFSCSIFLIDIYRLGWPLLIHLLLHGKQWNSACTRVSGLCELPDPGGKKLVRQLKSLLVSHLKASNVPGPAWACIISHYPAFELLPKVPFCQLILEMYPVPSS